MYHQYPLPVSHAASPKAILYCGSNFSGRTARLREELRALRRDGPTCILPPETDEAISGLAPTVHDELALARRRKDQEIRTLVDVLGFSCDRNQNPLTLSGGEKVLLVLIAAYSRGCSAVGIDVALEQLDVERRRRFLRAIPRWLQAGTSVLIADNRINDFGSSGILAIHMDRVAPNTAAHRAILTKLPTLPALAHDPQELLLDQIRFGYSRARPILCGVSAALRPGTVYHLDGANGSGKSTLAKLLIGRLRAHGGCMRYGGVCVDPWTAPGRFVAYHFQDPDVQLFTTRVITEFQPSSRQSPSWDEPLSLALAASFGLSDYLDQHPFDLPYVLRKRLALAAVIATNAPWLVIDEPTLGQDDTTTSQLAAMFRGLAGRGHGLIVISHNPSFVSQLHAVPLMLRHGMFSSM